jgi:hypothetical protein
MIQECHVLRVSGLVTHVLSNGAHNVGGGRGHNVDLLF